MFYCNEVSILFFKSLFLFIDNCDHTIFFLNFTIAFLTICIFDSLVFNKLFFVNLVADGNFISGVTCLTFSIAAFMYANN